MKAKRNKTIDFSIEDGQDYLDRCISVHAPMKLSEVKNRVILGDAFTVLPYLPEASVDLLIVDPPYNLNKNFSGNKFKKRCNDDYRNYTVSWIEKVKPLLKPDATVYVCCDWKSSLAIGAVLPDYFIVRNRITWQREKGRGAKANWKNSMEDIWFATNSNQYTFHLDAVKIRKKVVAPYRVDGRPKDWFETVNGRFRDTCPSNFWDDISIPYWSMPENTAHPTQKPEKLMAKLILASSDEGDLVVDPFLGSGTTAVTSYKLNRNFIGIEQNPQYCMWAQRRLEMACDNKAIQGYEDGVFWERNASAALKPRRQTSVFDTAQK